MIQLDPIRFDWCVVDELNTVIGCGKDTLVECACHVNCAHYDHHNGRPQLTCTTASATMAVVQD